MDSNVHRSGRHVDIASPHAEGAWLGGELLSDVKAITPPDAGERWPVLRLGRTLSKSTARAQSGIAAASRRMSSPKRTEGETAPAAGALLTATAVARRLGIGKRTFWRLTASGSFPPADIRIGAKIVRWKPETVEQWITTQSEGKR